MLSPLTGQWHAAFLCGSHHNDADACLLPPTLLINLKHSLATTPVTRLSHTESIDLIEHALENVDLLVGRCDMVYHNNFDLLIRLYALGPTIAGNHRLQQQWMTAVAWTQIRMAGALTSWRRADDIPWHESERYEINVHAENARRIGLRLDDKYIQLHANHNLAVNANALHEMEDASAYAFIVEALLATIALDAPRAAYLWRNIGVIFSKSGDFGAGNACIECSLHCADASGLNPAETHIRQAEVLMLSGGFRRAQQLLEREVLNRHELTPIQQIIALRDLATLELIVGGMRSGHVLLSEAIEVAGQSALGHQEGKCRHLLHASDGRSWKRARRRRMLNDPTRFALLSDVL